MTGAITKRSGHVASLLQLHAICLLFLSISFSDGLSSDTSTACPGTGTKGEPGVPGVPGPPGIRGHKGGEGPSGHTGSNGTKGTKGDEGPVGPPGNEGQGVAGPPGGPGPQGPPGKTGPAGVQGVIGPAGPPGPRGLTGKTGPPGPAGSRGPRGDAGGRGQRGERGLTGPRGNAGLDGVPGTAGPVGTRGPHGPKGVKGDIGLPGTKGEAGPQGIPGPEMSEDLLNRYFNPVKGLLQRVGDLEQWKQQWVTDRQIVAAHLRGSISTTYTISGVITYWSTDSPSFLLGGITYNNGHFTVPSDGVYYIYGQLYVNEASGQKYPNFRVNGSIVYYMEVNVSGGNRTMHSGFIRKLKRGDLVGIYGNGHQYWMGPLYNYVGMFKLH